VKMGEWVKEREGEEKKDGNCEKLSFESDPRLIPARKRED